MTSWPPLVGEHSLLCTEDEEWLRHRKLLGPAFHRKHVESFEEEIAEIAREQVGRWPRDVHFELRPRMQAITLEVILKLVLGLTEEPRLEQFRRALPGLLESAGGPALWLLPPSLWGNERVQRQLRRVPNAIRSFLGARDEVDALLYEEICQRRASRDESRRDVLSMLLGARDDEGRGMSDVELRDELITLLVAGHETTATALAWTFERLLRHPDVLARLISAVDDDEVYLDAVVRESLRSRPVVLDTPRLLNGSLEIGGYVIPAGWFIAPAIPTVQAYSEAVPDPEDFRPERFLDDPPRDAWIPFGGGKRHCVGSHLALLEMRVIVAEVLRQVALSTVDSRSERQRMQHVTLTPSRGARVVARARSERPKTDAAGVRVS